MSEEILNIIKGLSPLARGNHVPGEDMSGISGSIPAGAGEPHWIISFYFFFWVYPRWRGGTTAITRD